jgi:hypothetical protein
MPEPVGERVAPKNTHAKTDRKEPEAKLLDAILCTCGHRLKPRPPLLLTKNAQEMTTFGKREIQKHTSFCSV